MSMSLDDGEKAISEGAVPKSRKRQTEVSTHFQTTIFPKKRRQQKQQEEKRNPIKMKSDNSE